jgi:hypothetical protein
LVRAAHCSCLADPDSLGFTPVPINGGTFAVMVVAGLVLPTAWKLVGPTRRSDADVAA